MRTALLVVAALVTGAVATPLLAKDVTDVVPNRGGVTVEGRLQALEAEVARLEMREAALTRYVLANAERGNALLRLADDLVRLGFTARAVPAESREALVAGLRGMGVSLRDGLPMPTPAEKALVDAAATALRTHVAK
ncbi:MAG: hypothetical protein H6806_05610 [Planctomycetes bacterium]|nr:hypothetical protein [Planctomycetota bacterium]MCB9826026.1 hypothetical protein [Planctomycetota bacterium]MCB9829218.1 hypothetical protein [Planctomycetota bacterium]